MTARTTCTAQMELHLFTNEGMCFTGAPAKFYVNFKNYKEIHTHSVLSLAKALKIPPLFGTVHLFFFLVLSCRLVTTVASK